MLMTADKIHLADAPKFTGVFGNPDNLFHWQRLVEEFFDIKNLTDDKERFKLLGSLLTNKQMSSWFGSVKHELVGKPWGELMNKFSLGTLPVGWIRDREDQIRDIKMKPTETIDAYFTRGQELLCPIKAFGKFLDQDLARYLSRGGLKVFDSHIRKEKLLDVPQFSFIEFQAEAKDTWRVLQDSGQLNWFCYQRPINVGKLSMANPLMPQPLHAAINPCLDTLCLNKRRWNYL